MLLRSSLQPSSIPTYKRVWKLFQKFFFSFFLHACCPIPISPTILALFIAYMFNSHYAPSTVNTYVSAIGYSHKLFFFLDPTKVFYISQMLRGYGKIGFRLDSRLPITLPIFHCLIDTASQLPGSHYQICRFQAMCSLAFFCFSKDRRNNFSKTELKSSPSTLPTH